MSVLDRIVQQPLNSGQYYAEEFPKTQIYLHHTAGNSNPYNVITDWNTDDRGAIATCIVIGRGEHDGKILQAFSSKHWAHHLGVKQSVFAANGVPYKALDKTSIGIEICNWGQLVERGGKFYNYVNREVPASEVTTLATPFKGYKHYHSYTPAQIEAVKELLQLWKTRYNIPLTYNEDIWQVTKRALRGEPGVFTHNSVRADKVDVFPQPELIAMLKTL